MPENKETSPIIIDKLCEGFVIQLSRVKNEFEEEMYHIYENTYYESRNNYNQTKERIADKITVTTQGILVSLLQEFIDRCYLEFLKNVFNQKNSLRLKLQRIKSNISHPSIHRKDEYIEDEDYRWLTLQSIILDIWNAFRFESFKNKIEMLFKSIDFNIDDNNKKLVIKHVFLRNCIHHHLGNIPKKLMAQTREKNIVIRRTTGGDIILGAQDKVILTYEETQLLCQTLIDIANEFKMHTINRIAALEDKTI